MIPSAAAIRDLLTSIVLPDQSGDIVTHGLVSSIVLRDQKIGFALSSSALSQKELEALRSQCEHTLKHSFPEHNITIVLTSHQEAPPAPARKPAGVKHMIVIASGKGGVGKSTITTNLAATLHRHGARVAIADLDIYGPSIAHMCGNAQKPKTNEQNQLIPLHAHGIDFISMGNLLDPESPVVWRGPMLIKAMHQLVQFTAWHDIDYLLLDTPPGTGDIPLSLAKNYDVDGAILVSTPQDIALLDVQKAHEMFAKLQVPVIGIIENMSYFADPTTHQKHAIFGEGGAKRFAATHNIPFLGEVPLIPIMREQADKGEIFASQPHPDLAAFEFTATQILASAQKQ